MNVAFGIVVSCWHILIYHVIHTLPFGSPASVLLDEGANWTVFLGLSFLFGSTLVDRKPSEPTPAGIDVNFQTNDAASARSTLS